ncbi:amidase signature enzyme [Lophium mytilinum]|uniref:Amidase signature enzyme n=1 Tax=Lophium mytilinum TaxID=390894 RepID=A0A6A6RCB8_9PEZI|nr:amidase signature enzyme [Lophium mytilinum]
MEQEARSRLRVGSGDPVWLTSTRTFALGPVTYLVSSQSEAVTVDRQEPTLCTVIKSTPGTPITAAYLRTLVSTFTTADDVFRPEFLAELLFLDPPGAGVEMGADAQQQLEAFGTRWVVYLDQRAVPDLQPGPYVIMQKKLWKVWRVYSDSAGAFVEALRPGEMKARDAFERLEVGRTHEGVSVAVPSRLGYFAFMGAPLAGLRVLVKDNFHLKGLRTSLGNKAYLETYPSREKTATCIQQLVAAGAVIVGTAKLVSFAAWEEPTQCIDYQAPWNARADGYQSPAGSSSGSGAAIGAYDWLDIAIGSDTSGSGRRPGLWNGCFAMRPTFGLVPVDGLVSSFKLFDTPSFLGRNLQQMRSFASAWYGSRISTKNLKPISALIWPSDFWESINPAQRKLAQDFVGDLESFLGIQQEAVSFADEWSRAPPQEAASESQSDFMKDATKDAFWYDDYHALDSFRTDYQSKFNKQPYVSPPVRAQWESASKIDPAQRDEAVRRINVYRQWFLSAIMASEKRNALVILPIENVSPRYRDQPPPPFHAPSGVTTLTLSPILEAPELVVPIGEIPYQSVISGREEMLPVAVGLLALPGSDLLLMDLARGCLEKAGRPVSVHTGRYMFKKE